MSDRSYKRFLNIILVIIIIAIIGVVGYIVYEYVYLRNKIDANANEILDAFDKYMNTINNNANEIVDENQVAQENEIVEENKIQTNTNLQSSSGNYSSTGYALTYKGYGVLGKIELPKVGLQYPVLETMTDAKAIDISVAVQYGVRSKPSRKYSYYWA